MKLKCFESSDEFLIYRERRGVFAYVAFLGLFSAAIGYLFTFVIGSKDGQSPLIAFGVVFLIAGVASLFSINRIGKSSYKKLGIPVLLISKEQLIANPGIGSAPSKYGWHQVRKIVIAATLYFDDIDGPNREKNRIVVFFNPSTLESGTFANVNKQRSISAEGAIYSEFPFPDQLNSQQVKNAILNVCPLAPIETQDELRLV